MQRAAMLASLLAGALLAGCGDPGDGMSSCPGGAASASSRSLELGSIVPGDWHVSARRDNMMVWANNVGQRSAEGTWCLTLAGGEPLPDGWHVRFDPPSATLPGAVGTTGAASHGGWSHALATIHVPAGAVGVHEAELRFGRAVHPIRLEVQADGTQISKVADQVHVNYEGRFANGTLFDDGEFDTTLGGGRTVPGFDFGLTGLAPDERVTLVVPPALAYGYEQRDPNYVKFNGQTLHFTVRVSDIQGLDLGKLIAAEEACRPFEGVADPRPGVPEGQQDGVRVRFRTNLGDFTVETDAEHAPKTVANFLRYVDEGFYSCTTFHRISPGFVVQGGGFRPDHGFHKPTHDPIPLEATPEEKNVRWSLSMARTNLPDSATSEFFVNLVDNTRLDSSGPGTGYAVFAHVVEGQATIEAMLEVPAGRSFGTAGGHFPSEPIVILEARRA